MPKSAEEIRLLYEERKKDRHDILEAMREVTEHYDGDISVPLPEMNKNEKPAVANLLAEGVDQTALRVSSTMPNLECPALDPRKEKGKRSREYADIRRQAIGGWWDRNDIRHQMRYRARYLVAYGTRATMVMPDYENGIPKWSVRNPLSAYPAPKHDIHDIEPDDCIFLIKRTHAWLERNYPHGLAVIKKPDNSKPDDKYEVLEYCDDEEYCLVLLGKADNTQYGYTTNRGREDAVKLEEVPNRMGMCPVVMPERVTLNRICGQFNQTMGMYQAQARLMALDLIAVEKAVFPDLALVGEQGRVPQIQGDEWKDGRTGEINVVIDGSVEPVQLVPGFRTSESLDRLERGIHQAGIPSQWGGEQPTNIRTGRAGEITMSSQVDFRLQEYQEIEAKSLEAENRRAVNIAKNYFPNRKQFFVVHLPKFKGTADYEPAKHFETDQTSVTYPMPGTDANTAILGIGQRVGAGLMSRYSAMHQDPIVEDPKWEDSRITQERLEMALLESIQAQATEGAIPPSDLARIDQLVMQEGKSIYEAVQQAQEEAQERQADEVEEGAPEAQPGLAQPGAGAEAPEMIPGPEGGAENLQAVLRSLRQPGTPRGGAPQEQIMR